MSKDVQVKPLSVAEEKRLEQLEGVIRANMVGYVTVGLAWAEIRDRKLYREKHPTMEIYWKKEWEVSARRAAQLIRAAETHELISATKAHENRNNCSDFEEIRLPANEAQARELARLPKEQQPRVWQEAIESAPGHKPTASHIKRVVNNVLGEKVVRAIRDIQSRASKDIPDAVFKEAFNNFIEQVQRVRNEKYKNTSRAAVVAHLDAIRAVIAEDGDKIDDSAVFGGADDSNKLERAGYKLFRMEKGRNIIKERAGGGWIKHSGPYGSIREMEGEFALLMKDQKHLRG